MKGVDELSDGVRELMRKPFTGEARRAGTRSARSTKSRADVEAALAVALAEQAARGVSVRTFGGEHEATALELLVPKRSADGHPGFYL